MAGIINFRTLNRDSRWVFFLVCVATPPQLMSFYIKEHNDLINSFYNLYSVIELVLLFVLFSNKYHNGIHKLVYRLCFFVFLAFEIWIFQQKGLATKFINLLVSANNTVYVVWILLYLKEQYSLPETGIHRRNPFAWYTLPLLVYASCSAMIFALYFYIRLSPDYDWLWRIHNVCNILLYIGFSIGLYMPQQKKEVLE